MIRGLSLLRQIYVTAYSTAAWRSRFWEDAPYIDDLDGTPTSIDSLSTVAILRIPTSLLCGLTTVSCLSLTYGLVSERVGHVRSNLFFTSARQRDRPLVTEPPLAPEMAQNTPLASSITKPTALEVPEGNAAGDVSASQTEVSIQEPPEAKRRRSY